MPKTAGDHQLPVRNDAIHLCDTEVYGRGHPDGRGLGERRYDLSKFSPRFGGSPMPTHEGKMRDDCGGDDWRGLQEVVRGGPGGPINMGHADASPPHSPPSTGPCVAICFDILDVSSTPI